MYCEWYREVCPQKKCNGEGYVSCRMRRREIKYNRITREYRNSVIKNKQIDRVRCLSFLEKTLNAQTLNL